MDFKFKLNKDLVKDEAVFSALKEINFEKYVNKVLDWYSKDNFEKWHEYMGKYPSTNMNAHFGLESYAEYTFEKLAYKVKEVLAKDMSLSHSDFITSLLRSHFIKDTIKAHLVEWFVGQGEQEEYFSNGSLFEKWCDDNNPLLWKFFDKEGYKIFLKSRIKFLHKVVEDCVETLLYLQRSI